MRTFDAAPEIVRDLRDEGEVVTEKGHHDFKVIGVRHPTLGKIVIVEGRDGSGVIVKTDE